jgi:probable rRNA maturation factor
VSSENNVIAVTITNRQKTLPVDRRRVRQAVCQIIRDAHIVEARLSVAVVDDQMIAQLHNRFLNQPDPTDVMSFMLERSAHLLEGEVIVSADTARACAGRYHCTPDEELLRYIIHGTLHLVGYDDGTPRKRAIMKKREREYLKLLDL